jgi:hypothetical protein
MKLKVDKNQIVKLFLCLLILLTLTIYTKIIFADDNDPINEYNQDGYPHIENGTFISGSPDNLNTLGEGATYDIAENGTGSNYNVEVWYNSTPISYSGILNSINVTFNFTTNVTDLYSLQIYNWQSDEWNQTPCQFGSVEAYTPTQWWCNVTDNSMQYNSSDMKIRIKINSTIDSDVGLLIQDYIRYYISYTVGNLEVLLIEPSAILPNNVVQNYTFLVNATIFCKNAPCGNVNGTIMYNLSSIYPDTSINETYGDKPFFINEIPAYAMKSCPTNPLDSGEFCNLTWIINAAGDINTDWKIGVLFNSSFLDVQPNNTLNSTISILPCTVDINSAWSYIHFGNPDLNPNTYNNSAPGNTGNEYNISIKPGSCNTNLFISGTDLINSTYNSIIKVGNLSWSNISSDIKDGFFSLSESNSIIKLNVPQDTNVTTWYWLNVPPVYSGAYNGTIYITGVKSD